MKLITTDLINELILRAVNHARQRVNYNLHESLSDPIQRLFIAAGLESYFRPHRHPEKWECAVVIRGLFDVMVFDDSSRVTEHLSVGPGAGVIGFEIAPNTWHAWVPMSDGSVFFEIKPGPYDPLAAVDFAVWSPEEGTSHADRFVARLRQAKVGDLVAM
jgi:cupin fold WbuC family metalloprotein